MAKGWRISYFGKDDDLRMFLVGISKKDDAIGRVIGDQTGVSGIAAEPLTDEEFDKFNLFDGKIIESAEEG